MAERVVIHPQSPLGRDAVARLRARWRADPNGAPAHGRPPPLWGVCPCCRGESLGVGTWPDGSLRLSCWECGALEEDVIPALGLELPVDPWSREGMLARVEIAIKQLEGRRLTTLRTRRRR